VLVCLQDGIDVCFSKAMSTHTQSVAEESTDAAVPCMDPRENAWGCNKLLSKTSYMDHLTIVNVCVRVLLSSCCKCTFVGLERTTPTGCDDDIVQSALSKFVLDGVQVGQPIGKMFTRPFRLPYKSKCNVRYPHPYGANERTVKFNVRNPYSVPAQWSPR
jgi:hypothetical protein